MNTGMARHPNTFDIMEKFLDLVTLKNTTRGCDRLEALDEVIQKNAVPISNIISIATNGAPSMTSTKQGLIGLLNDDT